MAPPVDVLEESESRSFSRAYRRTTRRYCVVAETAASSETTTIREKLVRCLWFDQFFDPAGLKTEDGRKLAVFSPGYWNEGGGPDFLNAELSFDDQCRVRGDIEIHVDASDWTRHGHANDPAYGKVILHVVLRDASGANWVQHKTRPIPQLVLQEHLSADLEEIIQSLDPDDYPRVGSGREGPCCRATRALGRDERWTGRFLDIAGDERMLSKSDRFTKRIAQSTPDEAMYEALMESMGYSGNRRGFRLLANAVPLERLRRWVPLDAERTERLLAAEAILHGAAGFLDAEPNDAESVEYVGKLRRRWVPVSQEYSSPPLNHTAWAIGKTRPTNHPARRIAGMAAFLADHLHTGLCRAMMMAVEQAPNAGSERRQCRKIVDFFGDFFENADAFWKQRTTFGPSCLKRPMRLIGPSRTTEIIVNVVTPLLLALARPEESARIEQRLHNIYSSLTPAADNSVTRYMKSRIFTNEDAADRVACTIRRHQGLLQVFHDYCESASTTCAECGFLATIEGRVA